MENSPSSAAVRMMVHTGAVAAVAMILVAVAAFDAAAQTPSSRPDAPRIQADSFATPSTAKTAPVKPTKSCSSYGEGFVYVPGTDTCVRVGGGVRFQAGGSR